MKAILQKKLERLNAKKTALTTRAMNSTDANEVCLLLLESNGDNLTNLCTPFSFFKYPYALIPLTIMETLFIPASSPSW